MAESDARGREGTATDATEVASHDSTVQSSPDALTRTQPGAQVRSATPAPLARGATLGRYIVVEHLGGGGMGVVYAAYDPELERKLAVKLLRPDASSRLPASEGRARLLREAQAMARLSHPNVIAVHDVGTLGDQVFVAMELVHGHTLGEWSRSETRAWREVRDMFLQAGRGLAAAHAASLVHRDFKPDNVLCGDDGRARVLDFGLARAARSSEAPEEIRPDSTPDILTTPLTRTGSFMGTPAYAAPEQLLSRATDARSDQFSFCVAMWEALYGERPFAGDSVASLAEAAMAGAIGEPPSRRGVPARIEQALRRGLAAEPAARFPSMNELLAALSWDPEASRRRQLRTLAIAVGVAVLVAVLLVARRQQAQVCGGAERKLEGVWDEAHKRTVHDAFVRTGAPYAEDAWRGATAALDGWGRRFVALHTEACQATRVRGEQSEELLDLRMQCLEERRQEVRSLVDLFAAADSALMERAVQAARSAADLEACANTSALRQPVRPPADPAARAKVDALRVRLAAVRAQRDAGKFTAAEPEARAIVDEARTLAYRPLLAEALFALAELHHGEAAREEPLLEEAATAAEAGRHDRIVAEARVLLVEVIGDIQAKLGEAPRLADRARAAIERLGGDARLEARLLAIEGDLSYRQGRYDEAADRQRRALAAAERAFGPDDLLVADCLNGLANAVGDAGRLDESLGYYRRALAIREHALGASHPAIAAVLNNMGTVFDLQGKNDVAIEHFRHALEIKQRSQGPEHPDVAFYLNNIGQQLEKQHRFDEALDHFRRAERIWTAALPTAKHPFVGVAVHNQGDALRQLKRFAEAVREHERAIAIWEVAFGPKHPYIARGLTSLAHDHEEAGHPEPAIPPLRRALAIQAADAGGPIERADIEFSLARVLWDAGRDRAEARALAQKALAAYTTAGADRNEPRGEVAAWLAKHR